ncbi:MAG: hypothetical protein ACREOF_20545 [Gemmatimonadales bacterium]
MAAELELKAVVPDPVVLRVALVGAVPGFRGLMSDRRYDRDGTLVERDQVLRVRSCRPVAGQVRSEIAWKGPTRRARGGCNLRGELTCEAQPAPDRPDAILEALGYSVVHMIDRWVETWSIAGAALRLEWYPRMDVLVKVEGPPPSIEAAIVATGPPRAAFSAEALIDFVRRYEPRAGRPAALAVAELDGEAPGWDTA